jgi:hypothetical protein
LNFILFLFCDLENIKKTMAEAKLIDLTDKSSWGYLTFKKRLPQYVGDVIRAGAQHLPPLAIENLQKLKEEIENAGCVVQIQSVCLPPLGVHSHLIGWQGD